MARHIISKQATSKNILNLVLACSKIVLR